ncbi:MAG: DUF1905 domain-containing protein [Planctomycetota bacterium]|jgi:hypothetical protein
MPTFRTELIHGRKRPYSTWTFVRVPESVRAKFEGSGRLPVKCTLRRATFRGTLSRGEGDYRIHVKKELLEELGLAAGDRVQVTLELDREPRTFAIPGELQALLDGDAALARAYADLTPSLKRAWAQYIDEGKRQDTRDRRAKKAPAGIRARLYPNQ